MTTDVEKSPHGISWEQVDALIAQTCREYPADSAAVRLAAVTGRLRAELMGAIRLIGHLNQMPANWDEAEEGRPAPDTAQGLWLEASRWKPEHGQPDESGYVVSPPGTRCVGCGQELPPYKELIGPAFGSDGQHYHCGNCACYLEEG